jgi:hypothetical protein
MIKKFIEDNDLDFTGSGSELNGNCVILAGFALYKGFDENELVDTVIAEEKHTMDALVELRRVFKFAKKNNYSKAWETEAYKNKYVY